MTRRILLTLLVLGFGTAVYFLLPESCPEAAKRCAAIFVIAAGFWSLDLLPVYVTSLLVVLLLSFSLAKPGGVLDMDEKGYTVFLAPFSSPVLMLFFGGFVLAQGLNNNGCDRYLAWIALSRFTASSSIFIMGIMLSTAFLSLWISNTAATVIMLGMIRSFLEDSSFSASFRKGVLLAVPFSANIGGIGTPIGTPPNALAIGFLSDSGIIVNFLQWMILCLPLMLLLLGVAWAAILLIHGTADKAAEILLKSPPSLSRGGKGTLIIAGITILLWVTSPFHGIPEPLTALLCAGMLMATGLIDRNHIKNIDWDILILMWGGLALGVGIEKTGLGIWVVEQLFPVWGGAALALLFGSLALILSLFISNTAAAALIIPIALESAPADRPLFAITIALMCSVAMIFPVSTPPNALAFGTGQIENREMIKTGALITICCYLAILLGFWWVPEMLNVVS